MDADLNAKFNVVGIVSTGLKIDECIGSDKSIETGFE